MWADPWKVGTVGSSPAFPIKIGVKIMRTTYYCKDCKATFENVEWDGNHTRCPYCKSSYYIELIDKDYESSTPSDECMFP